MLTFYGFTKISDYMMSKPEGQRAVAMQAIMHQIQAEQEKAFAPKEPEVA